jgi:MoaA/NifB/PqqE/SkfB family radical SAM enzyme
MKKVIDIVSHQIKNKSKNFCPAPFRQIAINNLGQISACCMINEEGFGFFNENLNSSIDEIYSSEPWQGFLKSHLDENMPPICESSCGNQYPVEYHHQWTYVNREGWQEKTMDVKRADIAFSNLCNLSCTMCGPHWSSEWQKIIRSQGIPLFDGLTSWNFSEKQIKELAQLLSNCQLINIKGGEPFFNPRFKIFLKYLYELNPDVSLPILSNGTIVEDECFEILRKFKRVQYTISLESTQDNLYRLIRGGIKFSYSQIRDNVNYIRSHFPELTIKSNYILGAFNIDNFYEDMINLRKDGFSEVNILCVHAPREQSVRILNQECRNNFLKIFKTELEMYPNFYRTMKNDNNDNQIIEQLSQTDIDTVNDKEIYKLKEKCLEHIGRRNLEGCNFKEDITSFVPKYEKNLNIDSKG